MAVFLVVYATSFLLSFPHCCEQPFRIVPGLISQYEGGGLETGPFCWYTRTVCDFTPSLFLFLIGANSPFVL